MHGLFSAKLRLSVGKHTEKLPCKHFSLLARPNPPGPAVPRSSVFIRCWSADRLPKQSGGHDRLTADEKPLVWRGPGFRANEHAQSLTIKGRIASLLLTTLYIEDRARGVRSRFFAPSLLLYAVRGAKLMRDGYFWQNAMKGMTQGPMVMANAWVMRV